jgi:hypothetical protein
VGPLLFALALQPALEDSLAAVAEAHLVAIHDDVTLVATAEKVAALYAALDSRTATLGLRINPSKCAVYSPTPTAAAEVARKLGLPHASEGIVVAGSPIGSRGFVEAFGKEAAAQVTGVVPKLMQLPLETPTRAPPPAPLNGPPHHVPAADGAHQSGRGVHG